MNQKQKLVSLIGQQKYDELYSKIPPAFNQDIQFNISEYLLQKNDQQILDFYAELINNNNWRSTLKTVGINIILATHIEDLLIRLVEKKEIDSNIIRQVRELDLHYLIMFCTARYNIPEEHFVQMMELTHFRNMIAHNFNLLMETDPNQAIEAMAKGKLITKLLQIHL
ncbi:MAG: hypothetical protein AABX33_04125 [Nanoarchaeota archaeon]